MSLYRVRKVWYLDIPTTTGRIRRSTGTTDKKQAQTYHDRIKDQLWRQERLGENPPITWGEAVKKWLSIQDRGMPDRYRIRSFGMDENTGLPLTRTAAETILAGSSPGTWNRSLALIVAIHNCSNVPPPDVPRKPNPQGRTRWLSAEEWKSLRKQLLKTSPLLVDCADFTLSTGLRENNVLNLEWTQVDLGRRVAWIYADQAKGRQSIGVPLNDAAMAVLESRRGIDRKYVFGNPDYPLYKASNRAWYDALKASGMYKTGINWHCLRHTWASWAVMNGVTIMELKELGGWKTLQMVARYAHLAPEHLASASSKVKPISRNK
jgi:integrase